MEQADYKAPEMEELLYEEVVSKIMPAFIKFTDAVGVDNFLAVVAYCAVQVQLQIDKQTCGPLAADVWGKHLDHASKTNAKNWPLLKNTLDKVREQYKTDLILIPPQNPLAPLREMEAEIKTQGQVEEEAKKTGKVVDIKSRLAVQ